MRGGGVSWHTVHVIIYHIFSVLVKLNVATRVGSYTLGLQSDLHKFDAVRKEKDGKAFSLTSARVPTKMRRKSRCHLRKV